MHKLYELKKQLCEELETYAGKELNKANVEAIDTFAHACKNICKILEFCETEEGEGTYGTYNPYHNRVYGNMRMPDPMGYPDSRYGARGRSWNATRDSMGRYSGYGHDEMQMDEIAADLHKISEKLPDNLRMDVMKLAEKLRSM